MKLELKHLAHYLPYGLKVKYDRPNGLIESITNLYDIKDYDDLKIAIGYSNAEHIWMFKPILRPLSDLVKEINWGIQTYAFVDLFEIEDTGGCVWEFDNGNIKTIQLLKTISKYNLYHDINYLPFAVFKLMIEYHFDVFGLIDSGLAIDINTIENELKRI